MVNEKLVKDQNVPSEPKPKYMCTEQKEKQVTHSYNLRSKARQQQQIQQQQTDLNNNVKECEDLNRHGGGAIKRGYDYLDGVDNETEDDTTPFNSVSLSARKSPAKKAKFLVTYKEMNDFFNLLKEQSISEFLRRDACCLISDKYALAMVFTYFKRAKFTGEEFTVFNFYLALYLASDIEEDVDEYKYEIFPWALGPKWRSKFSGFLKKRDALLKRIGYRAIVSRKCCEEVMGFVCDHYAWKRERSEDHGGATRAYLITRGRRLLSSRSHLEEEELNLPRGPHELPRPCPLCFLNRPDTNLNHAKYIIPTPNLTFKPKLNQGYVNYPATYSNFMCDTDSADYDSSSNTSGYVSNESHASSNLSTYSTESSFYSSGIDLTIRKKDDLEFIETHLTQTHKQVKTPNKLKSYTNNVNLNINKDLNTNKQIEQCVVEKSDFLANNKIFFKPNDDESNFIHQNLVSIKSNFKQATFNNKTSNTNKQAYKSAYKYPSVACVNQYHVCSTDTDTDRERSDVYDENYDDDDVFEQTTTYEIRQSIKKKKTTCSLTTFDAYKRQHKTRVPEHVESVFGRLVQ